MPNIFKNLFKSPGYIEETRAFLGWVARRINIYRCLNGSVTYTYPHKEQLTGNSKDGFCLPLFIEVVCVVMAVAPSPDLNQRASGFFRMTLVLCPLVITSSKVGYSPTFFLFVMSVLVQTLLNNESTMDLYMQKCVNLSIVSCCWCSEIFNIFKTDEQWIFTIVSEETR